MKGEKNGLLLTVHSAMEFTWRYAWAGFVTGAVARRPLPLFEALAAFALAALLTVLSRGKGWRIFHVLGLQVTTLVLAAGVMVHAFYYRAFPVWSPRWIRAFFVCQRDPLEWIILVLLFFWILVFWAGGVSLVRRPPHYYAICNRLDLGLAAFFVLYLTEWLFLANGGIRTPDPLARLLIFPYLFFSLFAVGLARNHDSERREYLAGYRGVGLISMVLATLVLIGTVLFLLLLPSFTAVAETGYAVMKEAAEPLGPFLIGVLRFLLLGPRIRHEGPAGTGGKPGPVSMTATESSWWGDILEELAKWGLIGLLGATLLVLAGLGVWILVRWLLLRTAFTEKGEGHGNLISLWFERIRAFLNYCRTRILGKARGSRCAARLYAELLAWGRRSGIPPVQSETPGEYGTRLKGQFPALGKEIELIVKLYHGEVYGERAFTARQLASGRSAWRKLRSPLNWPSRLRSWIFRPGITAGPGR